MAAFKWGKWLSKHFTLSNNAAWSYMRLATLAQQDPGIV